MESEVWLISASVASLAGFAVFTFFASVTLLYRKWEQTAAHTTQRREGGPIRTAFLFDDDVLVDATPAARQLLTLSQRGGNCWARLMHLLRSRFPQVEEQLAELLDRGSITLTSLDGKSLLEARWLDGLARLELTDTDTGSGEGEVYIDRLSLQAMQQEVSLFRSMAAHFPYPSWMEGKGGEIIWTNTAYLDLAEQGETDGFPAWPPARIFPPLTPGSRSRHPLAQGSGKPRWYDIEHRSIEDQDLYIAVPADEVVAAEASRRELIQTLTKTFSALTLGLAVFDNNRRLVLFNPSLVELTGIGAEFLVQRPSFNAFAERLRDSRVLPEPRDFAAWKQAMSHAFAEAQRSEISETWDLPDGRIYQVQGRPIPDGSIAFLLQDVTDQVRLTRQFRSDLTRHQEILDRLEQPTVIFTDDGNIFTANEAYRRFWGEEAERSLPSAMAIWRQSCAEIADWDLDDLPAQGREVSAILLDGRELRARLSPLSAGATMIEFFPQSKALVAQAARRLG